MKRFLLMSLVVAVFAAVMTLPGCTFDQTHNERHWQSFKNDVHEAHHFVDRHFFQFDRRDPDNY